MRQRFCRMCGNWHDIGAWPVECFPDVADTRSDCIAVPNLIRDQMDPTWHPCTGETIDSKSKFSRITRANGCIEVGNDPARLRPPPKKKPDRAAIKRDLQIARARYERGERSG